MLPNALIAKLVKEKQLEKKNSASKTFKVRKPKVKKEKLDGPHVFPKKVKTEAVVKLEDSEFDEEILFSKKVEKEAVRKIEDFDEEIHDLAKNLRINLETVQMGLQGLIKLATENPKQEKKLFEDKHPIFLELNCIKTPLGHSKILRIPLKHSLLTPDSEICLIVADVKGIPNRNHEEHQEHYEKLLLRKGVTNIKKIMTFHELRTEYEVFEMKKRLVELYDMFLVDGRVSGKTVNKCGSIFYKKRKVPTAVKLHVTKLKEHIEHNLTKTFLFLRGNCDSFAVQVGHSQMPVEHIVENILYVGKGLEKDLPGGFGNIRSMHMFVHMRPKVPIYTTLKNQNSVKVLKGGKVKKEPVCGELTTRLNSGVMVKTNGQIEVYKLKDKKIKSE